MEISPRSNTNNWLAQSAVLSRQQTAAFSSLHLAVILGLAVSALIWGASFILDGEGIQLQRYLALLGFYAVSSAAFVVARIRRGKLQLFEIPVYITVMFFFQFGLIPLRNFTDPSQIDVNLSASGEELVQALAFMILGMMAFWAACELFRREESDRISPVLRPTSMVVEPQKASVLLAFGGLYAIGFVTRVYLLRNHLFSYATSMDKYYENLASMQVLNYLSQFGTLALIVATIERYHRRQDRLWRMLFIAVLISEVLWGLISGMKGLVLQNFLVVALVSSFVMRKLNLRWFVILFFGLVLLYPISTAYRAVVRGGGVEVTSFEGVVEAGRVTFSKMAEGESAGGDTWREGLDRALTRLDLLTSVAQVLSLGARASMVRGHVHWWMLPFYPFVPRFIWPSKPVLNESTWFTVALWGGSANPATIGSATAVTYPGDLYLQFGLLGIPVGMFVLGIVAQWFTNRASASVNPRELFVYTAVFLLGFGLEADAFSMWAGLIKLLATLYVLRLLIYGSGTQHRRMALSFRIQAHRRDTVHGSNPELRQAPQSSPEEAS